MRNTDKPRANPFVVLREEFDDWAILFNPDTGRGFGLSPTGVYVWKLLDGNHTVDALLEELREHTEGVPGEARDDLCVFVDALIAEGLTGLGLGQPDRETPHLENSSRLRVERGGEAKSSKYEPPRLMDFGVGQSALGRCCSPMGTSPGGSCSYTGACAGACSTGPSANSTCGDGSSATGYPYGSCQPGSLASTCGCGNSGGAGGDWGICGCGGANINTSYSCCMGQTPQHCGCTGGCSDSGPC